MLKQKFLKIVVATIVASIPLTALAQIDPNFNPNKLIEDNIFSDTQTFGGPEGVQKFLESRNSILANTNPAFLAMLKEPRLSHQTKGIKNFVCAV